MKIKKYLLSWDLILGIILAVIAYILLPERIPNKFAQEIYFIGISVLSIVFAVFFAALAIIQSSGDNAFIIFLEEEKYYTEIINTFKFTLFLLFVALIYSLILYGVSSVLVNFKCNNQTKWFITVFILLFFYGLFASGLTTLDAIKYSLYRAKFLTLLNEKKQDTDNNRKK